MIPNPFRHSGLRPGQFVRICGLQHLEEIDLGTRTSQFDATIDQVLGYLNFSSGAHDDPFFVAMNSLFAGLAKSGRQKAKPAPAYRRVHDLLLARLAKLPKDNPVFENSEQARRVIDLCFEQVLPAYLDFHRDVIFHQTDEFLFNSFFIARLFETILACEPLGSESRVLVPRILARFNDYLGHRPVAALETQKMEPYPHEWIRPVPLYIQAAGVAVGPYQKLVTQALEILQRTEPRILLAAQFDPDKLQELALDPRALDFDHPVNRRPNHHFGQWDEHSVDLRGYYRRFILHQVTLDALLRRCESEKQFPADQLLFEAGAVLACTMLMGSGVSGCGPGAYDSNTNLGKLVMIIANYRDEFYASLIERLPADHRQRLKIESQQRHQPFGAARQDINNQLGAQRDRQLVHCMLASLYARMGYDQAALKQSEIVPVASARINCRLDCLLSTIRRLTKAGQVVDAAAMLPQFFAELLRGINCGAIVDPWNILGFDANYSLFPAAENTIRDHRVDELVELMNQLFAACSRMWADAAAADQTELCEVIRSRFRELVDWWRKFAAHEVMSVDAVDPADVFSAAELVAKALNLWHRGGAATGDIEFWSQHAQLFDSPSAYSLVIDALLERQDFNTSRALLVHWLSQADRIPLEQGSYSFHDLLWGWLSQQKLQASGDDWKAAGEAWDRIRKLYDYLEANAEHYWKVPDFQVGRMEAISESAPEPDGEFPEDSDDDADIFDAAYDEVTYHDETDDGIDSPVFETDESVETELEAEVDRVVDRLQFLESIADYWHIAATFPLPELSEAESSDWEQARQQLERRRAIFSNWLDQAILNRDRLVELLHSISQYDLPSSGVDSESMSQYDRHRLYKESLMQQVAQTCVQVENAIRMLGAVIAATRHLQDHSRLESVDPRLETQQPVISVFAAVLLRRTSLVVDLFPSLNDHLRQQRLLYVPLSRGGNPADLVQFRTIQAAMRDLLGCLPGLGLLIETYELTELAMTMERNWPIDQGAVTEFDELFRVAFTSMLKAIIDTAQQSRLPPARKKNTRAKNRIDAHGPDDRLLFQCVEDLTESMLVVWLEHSRTLRLSVLEKVSERSGWQALVNFIQKYGHDLFTQEFLQLSNIRAILHQGVEAWLYKLQSSELEERFRLLDDIGSAIAHRRAVGLLTLILEATIENYGRYRDYNATTTQSDRGEMLFVLLDFLRLERRYDRISWNLKPVILAHQMLVRCGETGVARSWRRSLSERVGTEASKYITRLKKLREKYSVQMASIGHHLEGRFVQPMFIDRLVALVAPAMRSGDPVEAANAFELLQHECESFAKTSTGVGMDLPEWLAALEEEIDNVELPPRLQENTLFTPPLVAPISIPVETLVEQLKMLPRRSLEP